MCQDGLCSEKLAAIAMRGAQPWLNCELEVPRRRLLHAAGGAHRPGTVTPGQG
jgi:hypothetical protein